MVDKEIRYNAKILKLLLIFPVFFLNKQEKHVTCAQNTAFLCVFKYCAQMDQMVHGINFFDLLSDLN